MLLVGQRGASHVDVSHAWIARALAIFDVKQDMESSAISCWSKQAGASPWEFHFKPRYVAVGHVCPSHDRLQLVASPFVAAFFKLLTAAMKMQAQMGLFFSL